MKLALLALATAAQARLAPVSLRKPAALVPKRRPIPFPTRATLFPDARDLCDPSC